MLDDKHTKVINMRDLSDNPLLKDTTFRQWLDDTADQFYAEHHLDPKKYKILFSFEEDLVHIKAEEVV